jgi:hypothetical protein
LSVDAELLGQHLHGIGQATGAAAAGTEEFVLVRAQVRTDPAIQLISS